jgi:hypothetical protein
MLNQMKRLIINQLWHDYTQELPLVERIQRALQEQYHETLLWDHFALIDLPGPATGIEVLCQLFFQLGYEVRGQDYLSEKQNQFTWLADRATTSQQVKNAFPQIVVADFRREALHPQVGKIIDHYAAYVKPLDIDYLCYLQRRALTQDETAVYKFVNWIIHYLKNRDWPLPTVEEFTIVRTHNELLAWVLVMGHQVNHFAWAVHLSENFRDLATFNKFVHGNLRIPLNNKGGIIKACIERGIEQSATAPLTKSIALADGIIDLPNRFIEFVWRHSLLADNEKPVLWKDYFNGFVAHNADTVVESLYSA